jgi:hypothetical protein
LTFEDGVAFMSEFQKMRPMISRMSKQAGMGGSEGLEAEEMDPAMALAGGGGGNRNARRGGHRRRRAEVEGGWVSVQGEKSLEYFTICQEAGTKINIPMITYRFIQKYYK